MSLVIVVESCGAARRVVVRFFSAGSMWPREMVVVRLRVCETAG